MKSKGRPKLALDEKGNYSHILIGDEVLRTIQQVQPEEKEEPEALLKKLKTIKLEPEVADYYWKLVFTYSLFAYKNRKLTDAVFERKEKKEMERIKRLNLKEFAEVVGIEYYNFKTMYCGKGNSKNVLHYQCFLHENGINFINLQYSDMLINKAYSYYTLLKESVYSSDELKDLFF